MRKVISLLVFILMLVPVCAFAGQEVPLPNSRYMIEVPDWMDYNDPVDGAAGVEAYISADLEMDYISYPTATAAEMGMPGSLQETAEKLRANGTEAELRKIRGIEMICYRMKDEDADATPCIGYVIEDGGFIIEIDFWYATQEAADQAAEIIQTIRLIEEDQARHSEPDGFKKWEKVV